MTGSASALLTVSGLSRLAARQAQAVSRQQLADLGASRFHIASQLGARRWQLRRDVVRTSEHSRSRSF
jgi:hypothetical protein